MRSHPVSQQGYLPPLAWHRLTTYYDRVVGIAMRQRYYFDAIIEHCPSQPGLRILDLGSGTGRLSSTIQSARPDAPLFSVDPDRAATRIATQEKRTPRPCMAMAQSLPFFDGSFDVVVSSLVFHHLEREQKKAALLEIQRILRPDGTLLIADLGPARNPIAAAASVSVRLLDGISRTRDNFSGSLPAMVAAAGFTDVEAHPTVSTAAGTVWHYIGRKPAASAFH